MTKIAFFLLLAVTSPAIAQANNNCTKELPPIPKNEKMTVGEATELATAALTEAGCLLKARSKPALLKLNTADFDFQVAVDKDATLNGGYIVMLGGELDSTTTVETEFNYAIPSPEEADKFSADLKGLGKKPKVSPVDALAFAIVDAEIAYEENSTFTNPINQNVLSSGTVTITVTYAFKKDGYIEVQPKIGSVGIDGKVTLTKTSTQSIKLTFVST